MRSTGVVPSSLAQPIALVGLLGFGASLLFFVYCYVVVFARETTGAVSSTAMAIDIGLFTFFALHHSLFARDTPRRWVTQHAGALERSFYVWIASALFALACWLWQPIAGVAWRIDQPVVAWTLTIGQWLGVWLALHSAALIDIRELAGLKQLEPDEAGPPRFLTRGPYGWVRHPIYTGWFLIVFSVPLMTMTRLVFAIVSSTYLLIAIPFEERSLRVSSRGAYDRYIAAVPWRLLPRVY